MSDRKEHPDRYHAFMLRIWQGEEPAGWRASLEDPHSGITRGFASMKAMFAYLEACTSADSRTTFIDENVQSAE